MEGKTYEKIVKEFDELLETVEPEDVQPADLKPSKMTGASITVRLSAEDFLLLRRHVEARGTSLSEFARDALLAALANDSNDDPLTGLVAGAQQLAKLARKVEASRK
jgi:hypothetical protein